MIHYKFIKIHETVEQSVVLSIISTAYIWADYYLSAV